jgi:hypothetical protein
MPPLPPFEGLHPLVVHFPIALFLTALVPAALALVFRKRAGTWLWASTLLIALATAGAFAAVLTGEATEDIIGPTSQLIEDAIHDHEEAGEMVRNLFIVTLGFSAVLAFLGSREPSAQIDKTFGKGSIMRMDEDAYLSIPGISTGAISLDLALGGKGIPRGRIVEIFGPESSGKTTLALTVAANAQRDGGVAAFIDAEHALDPSWARKIGVNIDDLLVSQPDTGEQALEICELLVRSNAVDVIVIDSVAALIPKAEIEGEMGDSVVGLQARLMSQAMRKLTGVIARATAPSSSSTRSARRSA